MSRPSSAVVAMLVSLALLVAGPASVAAGDPPASEVGSWELLPLHTPMTPIHAALLKTGHVWLASGSGNDKAMFAAGEFHSWVWNPASGEFTDLETPYDVFGSGHSFLADGRLLIAGGTLRYNTTGDLRDWQGTRKACLFNPLTNDYEALPDMAAGRWYPTLVTLGDGRVYAISGINHTGSGAINRRPEIFVPGAQPQWKRKAATKLWPMYPSLLLTRDGRLFHSGGNVDRLYTMPAGFLSVASGGLAPVPGLTAAATREHSASVLLPPAQKQRVMIIGGGLFGAATGNVDIINLGAANPQFKPGPSLNYPRMHVNAVLLPDRTVLAVGGGAALESQPVLAAEVYDPGTNDWSVLASESVARLYHSFALLLPDGRVLVGGSNPVGHSETQLEIFSPPYMFRGPRPVIDEAPTEINYGDRIRITTTQAADIKWVSLIRPSAVTHTTDTEQRVVAVPFKRTRSGELALTITNEPNIAPPGWYMMFATNSDGVPSVAHWVHLG